MADVLAMTMAAVFSLVTGLKRDSDPGLAAILFVVASLRPDERLQDFIVGFRQRPHKPVRFPILKRSSVIRAR